MRSLALFSMLAAAKAVLLPGPTGPHSVAMQVHQMTDQSRIDPYSPENNRHHRKLLTSIFWPVEANSCTNVQVPYMPPATAEWYGNQAAALGLSNGTISALELDICEIPGPKKCGDGTKTPRYPLAIFSPGAGNSRLLYTLMARSLASTGYVVVTVDHPYDANIVEFPDGSIIESANISEETEPLEELIKVRAEDLSFVVSQLQDTSILTKRLRKTIDFARIVTFGHSLGGASSAMALMSDERLRGGANLDGRLFDPALSHGIDAPFLLLGRPNHRVEDTTWVEFWENLRGPKAELAIAGTVHGSYLDYLGIFSSLNLPEEAKSQLAPVVGTIDAERLDKVLISTLSSFFTAIFSNETTGFVETIQSFSEVSVTGLVL